jgi:signal transduction histidine kinase
MNYVLLTDVVLALLFIRDLFVTNNINEPLPLIILSIYFVMKLVLNVLDNKNHKFMLMVIINIYLMATTQWVVDFSLFIPFNLVLMCYINKAMLPSLLLIIFYYFKIPEVLKGQYVTYSFLTILVIIQSFYQQRRYQLLKDKNESLKERYNLKLIEIESAKVMNDSIIYQSQLEERNQLAQKLHDELGHTLAGNIMRLEAIKLALKEDEIKKMMEEVLANLRTGMDSIRSILKNIKPENSSINISSIKTMLSDIGSIDFDLEYSSDINLITPKMWKVINLNIKESITNMMKYSNATKCKVKFEGLNTLYKVTIKDDGIGCENIKPGIGISGIRQRMTEMDGQLIMDGRDGFSLTMIFKIEKENLNGD